MLHSKKWNFNKPIIFIIGHTSSGKTKLIGKLKDYKKNIYVINIDSTSIYRDINIGSSKPNKNELNEIDYKLINIIDPTQIYSIYEYYNKIINELKNNYNNNKIPILAGGSMFYFKYILKNYHYKYNYENANLKKFIDLKYYNLNYINKYNININDKYRIKKHIEKSIIKNIYNEKETNFIIKNYKIFKYILINNKKIDKSIKFRFYSMLENGLENEVRNLINRYDININTHSMNFIGYKEMILYINNYINYNDMINLSIKNTKKLYKKQMKWIKIFINKYYDINNIYFNSILNSIKKIIETYIKNINYV